MVAIGAVHQGNFKASVQALMLLFQLIHHGGGKGIKQQKKKDNHKKKGGGGGASSSQGASSLLAQRFYRALYEKIKSPEVLHTSTPVLFLNLLYKAMKADK